MADHFPEGNHSQFDIFTSALCNQGIYNLSSVLYSLMKPWTHVVLRCGQLLFV